MHKKIFAGLLLLIPTCCWGFGKGFYVGGGVGVDAVDFYTKSSVQRLNSFNVVNKTQLAGQGILGDIFGGYSWRYCQFNLAGEINGMLSNTQFQTSNEELNRNQIAETTYKINRSWGLSVLPGIFLPGSTLVYGRVGYVGGFFDIETTDNSLADASKMLNGIRYGLGVQKTICRNFDVRFEYSHLHYQSHEETVFEPVGGVTKTTTVSPENNQFELGVVYRFC